MKAMQFFNQFLKVLTFSTLLLGSNVLMANPSLESCSAGRYVAKFQLSSSSEFRNFTCPTPSQGNWRAFKFYNWENASQFNLPHQYCIYEATNLNDGDSISEPVFGVETQPSSLRSDCFAILTHGGNTNTTITKWNVLEGLFLNQLLSSYVENKPDQTIQPVRLAFLDTKQTENSDNTPILVPVGLELGNDDYKNDAHGQILTQIAERLTCIPDCKIDIVNRQALYASSESNEQTYTQGGSFLSLASAIYSEVESWQKNSPDSKLILNMSLGWEGEVFSGHDLSDPNLAPQIELIYQALQYASCRGVLSFAASGNHSNGPQPYTKGVLPAAWAEHSAPVPEQCLSSFNVVRAPLALDNREALLYAVGAMEDKGRLLFNMRETAVPETLSRGNFATGLSPGNEQVEATLSGTSVSTAVVSALASLVWHYFPDHSAYEVFNRVNLSGYPMMNLTASLCRGESCRTPRYIRHRTTMENICYETGCKVTKRWVPQHWHHFHNDAYFESSSWCSNQVMDVECINFQEIVYPMDNLCGDKTTYYSASDHDLTDYYCPQIRYYHQSVIGLGTQPGTHECIACGSTINYNSAAMLLPSAPHLLAPVIKMKSLRTNASSTSLSTNALQSNSQAGLRDESAEQISSSMTNRAQANNTKLRAANGSEQNDVPSIASRWFVDVFVKKKTTIADAFINADGLATLVFRLPENKSPGNDLTLVTDNEVYKIPKSRILPGEVIILENIPMHSKSIVNIHFVQSRNDIEFSETIPIKVWGYHSFVPG